MHQCWFLRVLHRRRAVSRQRRRQLHLHGAFLSFFCCFRVAPVRPRLSDCVWHVFALLVIVCCVCRAALSRSARPAPTASKTKTKPVRCSFFRHFSKRRACCMFQTLIAAAPCASRARAANNAGWTATATRTTRCTATVRTNSWPSTAHALLIRAPFTQRAFGFISLFFLFVLLLSHLHTQTQQMRDLCKYCVDAVRLVSTERDLRCVLDTENVLSARI